MARKYLSEREYVDLVGEENAETDDYRRLNGPLGLCREVLEVTESWSKVCSLPEGHGGDCSSEPQVDTGPGGRLRGGAGRRR